MSGRRILPAGLLAVLLGACASQHKPPPPSTEIDEGGFRAVVRRLSSDEFEGRRPGTAGAEKTAEYLSAQFRRLGLKPGFRDSFLQQVPLVEIMPTEVPALALSGGRGGALPLHYGKDMVLWSTREVPAVQLEHSPLVFVGYGIVAADYHWNDYAALDVHGKTVLVLDNDPGPAGADPSRFRGRAMSYYGRWAYKFEEAARQGAAGVLLIHDPRSEGYGWPALLSAWSGAQLKIARAEDPAGGPAVQGWISAEAAHGLFAAAGLDFDAEASAAARPGFKARAIGLTADASIHNAFRRFSSPNVIGVLPGSSRTHEYIVYTAHWDHLGRSADGTVLSGAVDNATGVAGLLMLAQSFGRTEPRPERSIAFIALTAEEPGLLGSSYYVENPVLSLRDTAAVLNLDGLHIGGRTRDVVVFGAGNSELEEYVRSAALLQGREVRPELHPEQGQYLRSAQFNFALYGVPSLYVKAGIDDSARGPKWGEAQLEEYLAQRYRQPADKYAESWDVRGAIDDLTLYYDVGERLADSRRFPRWYPGSEFSANHELGTGKP